MGSNERQHLVPKIKSLRRKLTISKVAKKIGLMEATLVELAIQDQLHREKLNLIVKIQSPTKPKKAS